MATETSPRPTSAALSRDNWNGCARSWRTPDTVIPSLVAVMVIEELEVIDIKKDERNWCPTAGVLAPIALEHARNQLLVTVGHLGSGVQLQHVTRGVIAAERAAAFQRHA